MSGFERWKDRIREERESKERNITTQEVFVVIARESSETDAEQGCYCVCDSRKTAQMIIDKDSLSGEIQTGAFIEPHVIQTPELI